MSEKQSRIHHFYFKSYLFFSLLHVCNFFPLIIDTHQICHQHLLNHSLKLNKNDDDRYHMKNNMHDSKQGICKEMIFDCGNQCKHDRHLDLTDDRRVIPRASKQGCSMNDSMGQSLRNCKFFKIITLQFFIIVWDLLFWGYTGYFYHPYHYFLFFIIQTSYVCMCLIFYILINSSMYQAKYIFVTPAKKVFKSQMPVYLQVNSDHPQLCM